MDKELYDYFIEQTNKHFDKIEKEMIDINESLKSLHKFRWQMVSGAIVTSAICGIGVQLGIFLSNQ